ncbi:MAG: metallophosphoesterase family protein [Chloroflexota bacterium]
MPPIRILHVADIHLGTELYGKLNPATGLSTRVGDFLATLDRIVDDALAKKLDLALFCGDIYRTRDPNPTYQREFAMRVHRLASSGMPVFLLVGNHDLPVATGRASSVDIFSALQVPNVHVARRPGLHVIQTPSGPLQIAALPWVLRSALLVKDEFKNKTLDEINQATADKIERVVRDLVDQLDPSLPSVMAAHASIMGAVYGSEQSVVLGQDIPLQKSVVADPAFDYVALGHVHKHQVVATRPLAVYCGSIERLDFGEEKEEKGYVVAEVERGGATFAFRAVPARRFLTIDVTAVGEDPLAEVLEAIAREEVSESVVRLRVRTTEEKEGLILEVEVRRALHEAHHIAGIAKIVERKARSRWTGQALREMTPREALAAYLRYKGLPAGRAKTLQEFGEAIIGEHPL